jgi:hypothetical protein
VDNKKEIQIEVQEGREMTDAEIDTVPSLLFSCWRREFEQQEHDDLQDKLRKQ